MQDIVGSYTWGIIPLNLNDSSNLATMSFSDRNNRLISANDQVRYQVQYQYSNLTEATEVGNAGNIVNVIFKVETTVTTDIGSTAAYWETIGTIKKSRDITNRKYDNGSAPKLHRFTIDVSQLVADQLSYSLCPLNKGTWQSNLYGGMNGGITMQDNVIGGLAATGNAVSQYNVSKNGTFRRLRVSATFEVLDSNDNIVVAQNDNGVVTTLDAISFPTLINSVNQFERDIVYYNARYSIDDDFETFRFLTRCKNMRPSTYVRPDFQKPVRIDEEGEFLQFYMYKASFNYAQVLAEGKQPITSSIGLKIQTYDAAGAQNTFYLRDFEDNLKLGNFSGFIMPSNKQEMMCIQNISPGYIINNSDKIYGPPGPTNAPNLFPFWPAYVGDTIDDDTVYYKVSMIKRQAFADQEVVTVTRFYDYVIDRESENIPYGFVRFHWLNSLGGIDSYTAKRDVVEGLSIDRDVIERKSADRTWYQADTFSVGGTSTTVSDSDYISNTMRGGDIYKGGREVSRVNAEREQSVYTEPLNKSVASWLEEILLSPNVWIEMDTDATQRANSGNPYQRPSTKGYIPVIITNSDIETVNQSEGLVRFNIEYILSHKVQTQRN
tara:strand:+ start:679 stop:2496 length:1818 start_codon:yes stop_codon:yes gene_type:complete